MTASEAPETPATPETQPKKGRFIYALLKIAEPAFAASFRSGTMYMNTLGYFRERQNQAGELVGDPLEGVAHIGQPSKLGRLQIGDHVVNPDELAGPVLFTSDEVLQLHAFCMYAVESGDFDSISEENMEQFVEYLKIQAEKLGLRGEQVVLISDAQAFLARVRAASQRENIYAEGRLMTYFDITEFHGTIDRPGFYKTNDYSAQREWRLVARIPRDDMHKFEASGAYKLEIGSIEDISIVTSVAEFNATTKFALPDEGEAEQGGVVG